MMECDPRGPLVIHAVKLYAAADGQSFLTFGRIYSGTIRPATQVRVLGEAYSPQDDEDAAFATVEAIYIPRGQLRTEVTMAKAGNWVLLQGLDNSIAKTATITTAKKPETMGFEGQDNNDLHIFAPLKFPQAGGESVMKLAIEPLNPAELPKMVEGLRRVSKAYPMIKTKVEESGEHILLGTGELYMDCVMHDLRHVYSDIEVKVADPIVSFRETVIDTSSIKCFSETANKRNKLTFMAEPLDEGLAEKLEENKSRLGPEKARSFLSDSIQLGLVVVALRMGLWRLANAWHKHFDG
jgi:U5 small nuclear ribonucleoprotein component